MPDQMNIEILEDGTISFITDAISQKNHASADEFLGEVQKLTGGNRETQKRKRGFAYTHSHAKGFVHY